MDGVAGQVDGAHVDDVVAADEPDVLPLVAQLVAALGAAGVTYCHWKSNEAIARSLAGQNDLDLLVARRDAATFARVVTGLGFCVARPPADRQLPGIVDYYAADTATARLVHVQAHYQLVLGDDMTKNLRLPMEDAYLRSVRSDGPLPVPIPLPSPEFEYLVFVLRMVVKHAPFDAQLDRKGRLTPSEKRELAHLEARVRQDEVSRLLRDHLPFVSPRLFSACASVAAERVGRVARAMTARQLLRALRTQARRSGAADLVLRMWRRRAAKVKRSIHGRVRRKRPDSGGLLIAIVGGDGAGKSSAVDFLADLLSHDFETERAHLGKPPWSRLSRAVKRPMRRLRTLGLFPATTLPPWADFRHAFPGLGFVVWHVLTARDRHLEYARVRRAVARGAIAVCDRFPLPAIRNMDAPRAATLPGLERRPLSAWLAAREARYYAQIRPPDLLVVLKVSPDVAVERRRGEDADAVRRRAAEVNDLDWSTTPSVVVDASASREAVHARIAEAVWAAL